MLRSEEVSSIVIYLQGDSIKTTLSELGEDSIIEFKKMSSNENLCLKEIEKLEQRLSVLKDKESHKKPIKEIEFEALKSEINNYYKIITKCKKEQKLLKEQLMLIEEKLIVKNVWNKFTERIKGAEYLNNSFIVSIVESDKKVLIRDVLEVLLREYFFIEFIDCDTKYSSKKKSMLILYTYGEFALNKSKSIITGMGGECYNVNELSIIMLEDEKKQLEDKYVINKNERLEIKEKTNDLYYSWKYTLNKEKELYKTVNYLISNSTDAKTFTCIDDLKNMSFIGECWIESKNLPILDNHVTFEKGKRFCYEIIKVKEKEKIPTVFKKNIYLEGFQNLTNVFGVPKYKEINPAVFMVFTFPFMFGAMFGDIFHSLILFLIATIMIYRFNKLNHNCGVLQILLDGRYVILSCAFSSFWFGLLYNDFASITMNLFSDVPSKTYPLGISPSWHHATNSMAFTNNLKMKLSLIIGFLHMELGFIIAIVNTINSNNITDLLCQILPQFLAFSIFLGYLVFLCVYKWLVTVNHPSLVGVLITMYTDPLNVKELMYLGQKNVQIFLLILIFLCIPWMLLSKPLYFILFKKDKLTESSKLDTWINSGIHTIEFLLGLISNTASYLRLWAVSLAHLQLTSVIHQFTISNPSIAKKILFFPVYLISTLLILIGLEGLSACLHALRLNWIEFFSKFYKGEGIAFKPLTFKMDHYDLYDEE